MTADIEVTKTDLEGNARPYFDINIENGDVKTIRSFDTAMKMSLFCERRANSSEVVPSQRRRGWWGNETGQVQGYEIGSKLWLIDQNRRTPEVLSKAIDFARTSLEWLIEDDHAEDVIVTGEFLDNGIRLFIRIIRDGSPVESRYFDLWENTGKID